jgi:hypothetical protein
MLQPMHHRAARPGQLPKALDATVMGERLPSGRLIVPGRTHGDTNAPTPVMWMTQACVADVGALSRSIAHGFAEHGLWPLVLDSLDGDGQRPWGDGELDPAGSGDPAAVTADEVLKAWWKQSVPSEEEDDDAVASLLPFGRRFPGLASASASSPDPEALDAVLAGRRGHLGLVAVTRPADVLAVLGWQGPINHFHDMAMLCAVLRSWEERFGAYLIEVGFDTITLAVTRPPATKQHATEIAAEHFAICSDCIYQGSDTIEEHAENLLGSSSWSFWWD